MNPQIETAKNSFEREIKQLQTDLAATPDDKLNWSPSPTARTPLQIAFHCAHVVGALHGSFQGRDTIPSIPTEQLDTLFRKQEKEPLSREDAVKKLEANAAAYITWLDALSDEQLSDTWHSPFGDIPFTVAITLPREHATGHVSQVQYIQTIYGDRTWR